MLIMPISIAHAEETPWWALGWSTPNMVQYGVRFDGEFVLSPGDVCASKTAPCILGSGGGIALNLGFLYGRTTYLGLSYSLTKQDPNRLYRLATLQQGRVEFRRYVETGKDLRFFGVAGGGIAGYGDEWTVDTFGPLLAFGFGTEVELSTQTVFVASVGYRGVRFSSFRDSAGTDRPWGVAHFLSLELGLEARSNL
jgi:hypothetical protein